MQRLLALLLLSQCLAASAAGELPIEVPGRVETLPQTYPDHWFWVGDPLLRRLALIDLEDGSMRGMVSTGYGIPQALLPTQRPELYVPDTYYSRGSRGERTDVLTIYDTASLAAIGEVRLPPKRALNAVPLVNATLSDDDHFAAIFNMTPATSLSIVDLEARTFAGEIDTPGCSLAYGAGPRRFASLCMDGALLWVTLDEAGREVSKQRSPPFFDPETDPVLEKAVRWRDLWLFVSVRGQVHGVDVSGEEPGFAEVWSLQEDAGPDPVWRIGGSQPLAVHEGAGRLYVLMHEGGEDTHKDAGTEVWVYDLESRERLQRIELDTPGFTYLGVPIESDPDWIWPFSRLSDWLLAAMPAVGADSIHVTQDASPRLLATGMFSGAVVAYDGLSGSFLARVYSGNLTNAALQTQPERE
jgi:methylamine dehydrogenase heavy chain